MTAVDQQEAPAGKPAATAFHRVLLKLSGEALMGDREFGLDPDCIDAIAAEIVEVHATGLEIAIVTGGGNIWRGMAAAAEGMDRHGGLRRDARDRPQLARPPGCARTARRADARHVRAGGLGGRRAVHPPPRDPPSREGTRRHLRGRDRQPVLLQRHGRRTARARDQRGSDPHGQTRGGGGLRRRSQARSERPVPARAHARGGDRARPQGDGCDRTVAVP